MGARIANRRAAFLVLILISAPPLRSQGPCSESDMTIPQGPQMVEVDLSLLRGGKGEGSLPEWSKIEKLRSFFKRYTSARAECLLIDADETDLLLFVARSSIPDPASDPASGDLDSEKGLQFFGSSRVKVERADKQVTRTYAFPLAGPAKISEVAETHQLEILLEDLAQVQLVSVPRLRRIPTAGSTGTEDCDLISSVTVVPSRAFDDCLPHGVVRNPASPSLWMLAAGPWNTWARKFDGCRGLTRSFQAAGSVRAKATGPDKSGLST